MDTTPVRPPFERPHFVVNARARSAHARAALREAVARTFPDARWRETSGPDDAMRLAREAADSGADLVVAVGGDGTINEVINGILTSQGARGDAGPGGGVDGRPTLGILPAGSGSDFARSLAIPRDVAGALAVLATGRHRRIDAGKIVCALPDADTAPEPAERFFINMGGCGASAEVARRFNRRRIPGALGYAAAAVMTTLTYRWPRVDIRLDGGEPRRVTLNMLFVANGEYCGGGMQAARGARPDDGRLLVIQAAGISRLRTMLEWPRLYRGHLARVRGVSTASAARVEVRSDEEVLVDCDGEVVGRLPAVYEIVPGAITVCAP